jgi:hypothetical protein
MKTLTLELPDDMYERLARRAAEAHMSPSEQIVELLKRSAGAVQDEAVAAARARMQKLFETVKGFRMGAKVPREELYERGSLH